MAAVTAGLVISGAGLANSVYQGNKASKAAKRATNAQVSAAQAAQEGVSSQFETTRQDLSPYRSLGEGAAPLLSEFNTNPQAQFDFLQSNPIFQASLNMRDRASIGSAASQGRIGTGGVSAQLQENYLMSALPLIQQREQQLLNLTNIGGNAAARTGQAGAQAASIGAEYGLQGANATAAGIAAQQQNRSNTANAILTGASTAMPLFQSAFSGNASTQGSTLGSRPQDYSDDIMSGWQGGE